MFNSETIARLLETADPAISLYFPLQPGQRDIRAPAARFREMIGEADAMLTRDGLEERRRAALLEPLRRLEAEIDFARHRDPVLAIFSCDRFTLTEPLPQPVAACVTVGPDFHIKPLLPLLAINRHFFILALSKSHVRLLAATPFQTEEVPLEHLPVDAQAELDSQAESGAAATDTAERRMALIVQTPRRIEFAVRAALGPNAAPVVIVGDPKVAGSFMSGTDLPGVLEEPIGINPFALPDDELLKKVMARMEPLLSNDMNTVMEQINARLGTAEPTVTARLEDILHAAQEGRVEAVLVAEDETVWGQFAPDKIVSAHGRRSPHDEDLLNLAVVSAMRTGGRAYAAPHARLPRQMPASALLRY